jgi:hypothetical protein
MDTHVTIKPDVNTAAGFLLIERRRKAYRKHQLGQSLTAIAEEFNVHPSTIFRDIRWVESEGAAVLAESTRALYSEVWAKYDALYQEAMMGWVRSQQDTVTSTNKTVEGGGNSDGRNETSEQKKTSAGDPRFLTMAEACLAKQALLAGFVQDAKSGKPVLRESTEDESDDGDVIEIIEVTNREEAAALEGKRYCRIAGPVESDD